LLKNGPGTEAIAPYKLPLKNCESHPARPDKHHQQMPACILAVEAAKETALLKDYSVAVDVL